MSEQRCGTCRWWDVEKSLNLAECLYIIKPLPKWVSEAMGDGNNMMFANEGKDCPTWHAK